MNGWLGHLVVAAIVTMILGLAAWNFATLQSLSVEVAVISSNQKWVMERIVTIERGLKDTRELLLRHLGRGDRGDRSLP